MEKNWRETRQEKYDRENTVRYSIKLNRNTDREIIAEVERMTGKTDPKTGRPWTIQGAIRHLLYTAMFDNPDVLTLIQEARKLSPEQLETVIQIVERINAGEDVSQIIMAE